MMKRKKLRIDPRSLLDRQPREFFEDYLERTKVVDADVDEVRRGFEIVRELDTRRADPKKDPVIIRWLESVERGEPDFGIYDSDFYLGALWACWVGYSRASLKAIKAKCTFPEAKVVVDVGNGIGYTTLALSGLFPDARVVGTNLPDVRQARIADGLGVEVVDGPEEVRSEATIVFASEYFEHFERPIDHLREVIFHLSPEYLVVVNSFSITAIGHFPRYIVSERLVDPPVVSRAFGSELRTLGYEKLKLPIWNARPAVWRRK